MRVRTVCPVRVVADEVATRPDQLFGWERMSTGLVCRLRCTVLGGHGRCRERGRRSAVFPLLIGVLVAGSAATLPADEVQSDWDDQFALVDRTGRTTSEDPDFADAGTTWVFRGVAEQVPITAGRPTAHTATVNLAMMEAIEGGIVYREGDGAYPAEPDEWASYAAGELIERDLTGLSADTQCHAKLIYRRPGSGEVFSSPECSFRTQRPPSGTAASFRFGVLADSHNWKVIKSADASDRMALMDVTLGNMVSRKYDFALDLGDSILCESPSMPASAANQTEADVRTVEWRRTMGPLMRACPVFAVAGNHEGMQGWRTANDDPLAEWAAKSWLKYTLNPPKNSVFYNGDLALLRPEWPGPAVSDTRTVYAWKWGDCLFIVLDPYWWTMEKPHQAGYPTHDTAPYQKDPWRWTLGEGQYQWLHTVLANTTAKWKFVFIHQLVGGKTQTVGAYGRGGVEFVDYSVAGNATCEWGGQESDGTDGMPTRRPTFVYGCIHDMLVEYGVDAVFIGHDHFYAHQEYERVHYVHVPCPNKTTSLWGRRDEGSYVEGTLLENSGHVDVAIVDDGLEGRSATVTYYQAFLPGGGENMRVADSFSLE